ncbi:MAG: gamma-glutamyl-gamma-aminobutyrate hydrolase family protein, partial [Firmicutes bacterium]|nr:gamma-glutamyl-gamma-aminobutyrate hydrolase family protein [Bacillota bacterium]
GGMARRYLELVDGLLLSGGGDVEPRYFGQEPMCGTGKVFPERDSFEIELVRVALQQDLPVVSICRGIQVLNIALGGDIYQDIFSQVPGALEHSQKIPRSFPWHKVDLVPGSRLGKIFGREEIRVNSFHHQAVKTVAPGFEVTARAADGLTEAIESSERRFAIGVQWHPEAMAPTDPMSIKLFEAFAVACRVQG